MCPFSFPKLRTTYGEPNVQQICCVFALIQSCVQHTVGQTCNNFAVSLLLSKVAYNIRWAKRATNLLCLCSYPKLRTTYGEPNVQQIWCVFALIQSCVQHTVSQTCNKFAASFLFSKVAYNIRWAKRATNLLRPFSFPKLRTTYGEPNGQQICCVLSLFQSCVQHTVSQTGNKFAASFLFSKVAYNIRWAKRATNLLCPFSFPKLRTTYGEPNGQQICCVFALIQSCVQHTVSQTCNKFAVSLLLSKVAYNIRWAKRATNLVCLCSYPKLRTTYGEPNVQQICCVLSLFQSCVQHTVSQTCNKFAASFLFSKVAYNIRWAKRATNLLCPCSFPKLRTTYSEPNGQQICCVLAPFKSCVQHTAGKTCNTFAVSLLFSKVAYNIQWAKRATNLLCPCSFPKLRTTYSEPNGQQICCVLALFQSCVQHTVSQTGNKFAVSLPPSKVAYNIRPAKTCNNFGVSLLPSKVAYHIRPAKTCNNFGVSLLPSKVAYHIRPAKTCNNFGVSLLPSKVAYHIRPAKLAAIFLCPCSLQKLRTTYGRLKLAIILVCPCSLQKLRTTYGRQNLQQFFCVLAPFKSCVPHTAG